MKTLLAATLLLLATGCATYSGPRHAQDPWEGYNRNMYQFNKTVDRAVLRPVAETYQTVVPEPARVGVANFYSNIEDVSNTVNNILQGKVDAGLADLGRFLLNSTLGMAGLVDIATAVGIEKSSEDFGQTLGVWGVPAGPYFVIPFLGPSTARDAPARYVDPRFFYDRDISNVFLRNTLFALDVVRSRAALLRADKVLEQAGGIDEYAFVRDGWLQRRQNQVYDGRPPKSKDDD
jgi:phospholipid-binding lipoprotein MlaA